MTQQVFSGEEFNEKYKEYEFYKLLRKNLTHYGYTYKDGLNVDVNEFNPKGKYSKAGLYFTEKNKIPMWMNAYWFITKCFIPNDAKVCVENDKFRSDKLIVEINNKVDICDSLIWYDESYCKMAVQQFGLSLKFVKEQTEEICKLAVQQDGNALLYVKEQTEEICKASVQKYGYSLEFVKEQTEEICKLAVQQNHYALQFVKEQTEEICKLAVQKNGNSLRFVKEQTEEICKLAVQQDGYALEFVKDQTEEICKLAVQQNGNALKYVKEQTEEICNLAKQENIGSLKYIKEQAEEICKLAEQQYEQTMYNETMYELSPKWNIITICEKINQRNI